MKRRFLNTLLIMSLCSFVLAGCGSTAQTSETEDTEETTVVESEATPTPEAEPETTEETKETEEVETETVETTETETQPGEAEESSAYTFTDMDATKYAKSSVNVRSLPDASGDKLGSLNTNDEVHITGQCNETGWFRFEYNGSVAYVSDSYLADEKVEEQPVTNDGGDSSEACPYQLNVWTQSTSEWGYPIFICYSQYNNLTDAIYTGGAKYTSDGRPYVEAVANGGYGAFYETCALPYAGSYACHSITNTTKVGNYAEGTIYKFVSGYHYYPFGEMNVSAVDPGGCAPGKYN